MRRIEPLLRAALEGPCRVPRGARILIAASGGADSTALLIGLARLAHERALSLHVAHLHHGLRGAAADADRAEVEGLCERLGLRCTSARWDTRARMRRRGLSGQRGLRVLRREFLSTVARRVAADRIATGHTADDQLETLLMRLGRGTGLTGAAGIDARRARWIRPLLAATRAEIEADLRGAGIEWREDSSNLSPDYLRNRIRHGAIPALLEALGGADGPRARADVARSAAQLMSEVGQVSRWLKARAHRIEQPLAVAGLESVKLDVSGLIRLPSFILRRVLARTWRRFSNEPLARPHLVMLERLARSTRRCGPLALPGGASASCTRGVLSITAFASSGPILRKQRFMSYICRSHPLSDGAISPQRRTRRAPGP